MTGYYVGVFIALTATGYLFSKINTFNTISQLIDSYKKSARLLANQTDNAEDEIFNLVGSQFKIMGIILVKMILATLPFSIYMALIVIFKEEYDLTSIKFVIISIISFSTFPVYNKMAKN